MMKTHTDITGILKCAGVLIILYAVFFGGTAQAGDDPWAGLRQRFPEKKESPQPVKKIAPPVKNDPWKRLQAVFLPFSEDEEAFAFKYPKKAKDFSRKINLRLVRFEPQIKEASRRFNIPAGVIRAVIMAESGGDPFARAKQSSAKGLMQTIDSTFAMARKGLRQTGINIKDDPFDPRASIMAGTWYLSRMYAKAFEDGKMDRRDKNDIASWRYPLEYYYAGPSNGIRTQNKIMVFSNGTRRIIDKRAYSKKIQKWAQILAG